MDCGCLFLEMSSLDVMRKWCLSVGPAWPGEGMLQRSEEHTSEHQSHRFIAYAVFCLKKIFFNDTATTEIYTLSLHDALPIWMKNPGTPYRLEMRADSLSSNEEVSHLSTSTSRGVFP